MNTYFSIGDKLDVLDETSTWLPAQITAIVDDQVYAIHFLFFDNKYNTEMDFADQHTLSRTAPYGTHTFVNQDSTLQVNQRVDVFDLHPSKNVWRKAKIIEVTKTEVRVHYWNFADKFDETIGRKSRRIAPYGYCTMATHADWHSANKDQTRAARFSYGQKTDRHSGRTQAKGNGNYEDDNDENNYGHYDETTTTHDERRRRKTFVPTATELDRYVNALAAHNLYIVGAEGDGNCLFRTVSHQIYGTQEHHGLIRQACVDYMNNESAYFSNFVALSASGFHTFDEYLNNMRVDGEWGDEPEIQAMCEMYDRPADVYVYDEQDGCRIGKWWVGWGWGVVGVGWCGWVVWLGGG